jgi:hypothetical protein
MSDLGINWRSVLWEFLILFFMPMQIAWAQKVATHDVPECGKAKVQLSNPQYLTTSEGIVVVEPPNGWVLDKTKKNPFYFVKQGENYDSARTLMYIHVERLEASFRSAVQNDAQSFGKGCDFVDIQDFPKTGLLEEGCESKAQMFSCHRQKNPYVDLVTKISIGGLLLNVVLSADNKSQILEYRTDYDFLLRHLTMVK